MVSKDESRKKDVGNILLGFAILMFGMEAMSQSVAPLAEDASFARLFTKFSNPLLGVLVGAVLTAIIHKTCHWQLLLHTLVFKALQRL